MQHQSVALTVQADPSSADPFLRATDVIDWTAPEIQALARELAAGAADPLEIARACFEWVRDRIGHCVDYDRDEVTCNASEVLQVGTGFCYAKSHLLVALLRANGLRAGFCYQRLVVNDPTGPFVLHGLAAVDLGAKPGRFGSSWRRSAPTRAPVPCSESCPTLPPKPNSNRERWPSATARDVRLTRRADDGPRY